MLEVTEGNESVTVPTSVRDDDGSWSQGTAKEPKREVLWRRLQAGQDRALVGGQFQTPKGRQFTLPGPGWSWLYLKHELEGVPLIRFVLERGEEDPAVDSPVTLYVWDPSNPANGLAVRGRAEDFANSNSREASNGALTIGWAGPGEVSDAVAPARAEVYPPKLVGDDEPETAESDANPEPIDPEEPADGLDPRDTSK